MPSILITGAGGQVGRELLALRKSFPALSLLPAGHRTLDITDPAAIAGFLDRRPVNYCINCAAYTAVDRAESEPELARRINVEGPALLATCCAERRIPLLHLSSDYVYHNRLNRPLREEDPTTPKSVYARTKLAGDQQVLKHHPYSIVVRTSWVYAAFGHNFVKTMIRLGKERESLRIVYDQVGAPTYGHDLAKALLLIIEKIDRREVASNKWPGIYHYANEGVTSWYDLALTIFELCGINCCVEPIESKEYPTPASRPSFSLLNKNKIKNTFDIDIPHWKSSLQDCLERLAEGERD
jgi:dTDP-4-dehydrorhamnose reductase